MDIMVSGTVGAAFQGYFRGIPSIAISVASLNNVRFEEAGRTAKSVANTILNYQENKNGIFLIYNQLRIINYRQLPQKFYQKISPLFVSNNPLQMLPINMLYSKKVILSLIPKNVKFRKLK